MPPIGNKCESCGGVREVPGDEIIDVDVDPREARRSFWRRVGRVGIPLAGVVLIVAAIIAIALLSYRSNRSDALALSQELIEALDQRVRAEVEAYLAPAAQAVRMVAGMLPDEQLTAAGRAQVEPLAMQLLRDLPQLASLFVGDPEGSFLMVQRTPDGALDTKVIERDGPRRQSTWYRRDPAGEIVAVEQDPADRFDPRTRPWYQGATSSDGIYWTDVYVFFTDHKPGLTASLAGHGPDGQLRAVVGGDIRLAALSDFLGTLEIGVNGQAMIVDADGILVAFPDSARLVQTGTDELRPAQLDDLDDALLTQIYDRFRVSGHGRSIVSIDGQSYLVAASSLSGMVARDWSLLFVVPEADFIGFVENNGRRMLLMSSGIVALAIGLAVLLAYQGLIAERTAGAVRQGQRALAAQASAFEELGTTAPLLETGDESALRRLTETVARALAARRVSLWQLDGRHSEIVCAHCFDQESRGHTTGAEIRRAECPELFAALLEGDEVVVADAAADPRTAQLHKLYLSPVGCRALLSVPIATSQGVVGFIWVEDVDTAGRRAVDAISFARIVAQMLGARFAAHIRPESAEASLPSAVAGGGAGPGLPASRLGASPSALRTTSLASTRERALLRQIDARNLGDDRLLATVFPHTTVLVLRLFDDLAMAARADAGQEIGVIEGIVAAFQQITERLEVRYVKILTDQIVAAEGFDGDAHAAAVKLAEAALALQDECARRFAHLGGRLDYAIGLDTGTVIGSSVGFEPSAYNVWGEAVRVASALAASARRGTIQASEAAYEQLRDRFVLRRRGGFYLEQVGEMSTYALRGRL